VDYFTPHTIKPDFLPPELSKTGQIKRGCGGLFDWFWKVQGVENPVL